MAGRLLYNSDERHRGLVIALSTPSTLTDRTMERLDDKTMVASPPSVQIAQSLRSNGNLRLLDISFNNMKPRSAMVLANALLDNS